MKGATESLAKAAMYVDTNVYTATHHHLGPMSRGTLNKRVLALGTLNKRFYREKRRLVNYHNVKKDGATHNGPNSEESHNKPAIIEQELLGGNECVTP